MKNPDRASPPLPGRNRRLSPGDRIVPGPDAVGTRHRRDPGFGSSNIEKDKVLFEENQPRENLFLIFRGSVQLL